VQPGLWGAVTASHDWCEINYQHTPVVCELYNSVSSLAMLAAGLAGMWLHRRTLEPRFQLAYFIVAVVGLGSIAFHATLHRELQLLDELPMLYSALVMVYILLEDRPARRFGPWFPAALAAVALLGTASELFLRGPLQFTLFLIIFSALEFFGLFRTWVIFRRSRDPIVRRLFGAGIALYGAAELCWMADFRGCAFLGGFLPAHGLPNPQLHAWWHVLVSGGLYTLTLMIAYQRLQVLGAHPTVDWARGWLPFVRSVSGLPERRSGARPPRHPQPPIPR
jgi:dihydroceramidase